MSELSVKERLDDLDLIELKLGEGINELKELRFDEIPENIDHVTCSAEETRSERDTFYDRYRKFFLLLDRR